MVTDEALCSRRSLNVRLPFEWGEDNVKTMLVSGSPRVSEVGTFIAKFV
jgi:hypothetical protein